MQPQQLSRLIFKRSSSRNNGASHKFTRSLSVGEGLNMNNNNNNNNGNSSSSKISNAQNASSSSSSSSSSSKNRETEKKVIVYSFANQKPRNLDKLYELTPITLQELKSDYGMQRMTPELRQSTLKALDGWEFMKPKLSISEVSKEDIGYFYPTSFVYQTLPDPTKLPPLASKQPPKLLPVSQKIPEGLQGELENPFHEIAACHLLVRESTITLLDRIRQASSLENSVSDQTASKMIINLRGRRGMGKTAHLLQAVEFCRSNNWLVLYAPNPWEWSHVTTSWKYGTEDGDTFIQIPDRHGLGEKKLYGQPIAAKKILENFKLMHGDQIKSLPQRRKYDHKLYMSASGSGNNLNLIVARGLSSNQHAPGALYDLRMELSLVEEFPVLIATDQINTMYWPTSYYLKRDLPYPERFHPEWMLTHRTFRSLDELTGKVRPGYALKRGCILNAVTEKYTPPHQKSRKDVKVSPFPETDKSSNIWIKEYNDEELKRVMKYYHIAKVFTNDSQLDSACLAQQKLSTNGVPSKVYSRATKLLTL